MKKLDPKDVQAQLARDAQRGPLLPGDPIAAMARAQAAASKRVTLRDRIAELFSRQRAEPAFEIRERMAASVEGRQDAFERVAEQMPVDPPEIAYLAQRRAAAGR
jgi:hypothetical protein